MGRSLALLLTGLGLLVAVLASAQDYNIAFRPRPASTVTTSLLFGGSAQVLDDLNSSGEFFPLMGFSNWDPIAIERTGLATADGTFQNMEVRLSADIGGGGNDVTVTLYKNGSPSAFTCTITGGFAPDDDDCSYSTTTLDVAPGDGFTWFADDTTITTPDLVLSASVEFVPDSGSPTLVMGSRQAATPDATGYTGAGVSGGTLENDVDDASSFIPIAGSLSDLYVEMDATITEPDDVIFTLMIDGVADNTLECTVNSVSGDGVTCNDTTGSIAIGATGAWVSLRIDPNDTLPAITNFAWGMTFTPDATEKFLIGLVQGDNQHPPLVDSYDLVGRIDLSPSTTETPVQAAITRSVDFTDIGVKLENSPSEVTASSFTYTLRDGGFDTNLSAVVSDASKTLGTCTDCSVTDGDLINYEIAPGSPAPFAPSSFGHSLGMAATLP